MLMHSFRNPESETVNEEGSQEWFRSMWEGKSEDEPASQEDNDASNDDNDQDDFGDDFDEFAEEGDDFGDFDEAEDVVTPQPAPTPAPQPAPPDILGDLVSSSQIKVSIPSTDVPYSLL